MSILIRVVDQICRLTTQVIEASKLHLCKDEGRSAARVAAVLCLIVFSSTVFAQKGNPVYVEDSPDAEELVKQAEHLYKQNRLTDAVAMYQKASDEYGHRLIKWDNDVYVDVVRWVKLKVGGDAKLLTAYRALYEPAARRALVQAAIPQPSLSELDRVAQRFSLCEAGLAAAMDVSAILLESGDYIEASVVLSDFETHSNLIKHEELVGGTDISQQDDLTRENKRAQYQQRWHRLQAAIALYGQDATAFDKHVSMLKKLQDQAGVVELGSWKKQLKLQAGHGNPTTVQSLQKVVLPDPLGKALYQIDATPKGVVRVATDSVGRPLGKRSVEHTVLPVAHEEVMYLNTGAYVRAVDRSSLSDIWSEPFSLKLVDGSTNGFYSTRQRLIYDMRSVLVDGNALVAVMGEDGVSGSGGLNTSQPETSLVGIDRRRGVALWKKTPGELDKQLENAFFHGTAVGGDGTAYVMLRRTQNSGFRDGYLVAVSTRTGQLRWKRHLSSATIHYSNRGLTQPLFRGGRLYVADNLGAVACIDSRSGSIRWLYRVSHLRQNVIGASLVAGEPWQVSRPILIGAGLVIPPFVPGVAALLLNPDTGKRIGLLDKEAFTQAQYLTAAGADLISIASDVRLFDGQTLKLKWTHALGSNVVAKARVAITADRVLVPIENKLVVLDLASGKKVSESSLAVSGNVLALKGQLVISSGTRVASYMTWPVVYDNLAARIKANPSDPQPGLALARAAFASGRSQEAMQGVKHVVAVLRHRDLVRPASIRPEADTVHAETFSQLIRLSDAKVASNAKTRGLIFDEIAKAASTPGDEVQYHLAYGKYLIDTEWPALEQNDRRRDAVRHYQTVLENAQLASQLYKIGGGWKQAGLEARQRLANLIERFSRNVYSDYDERAAAALEALLQTSQPTAMAFIEVARRYPLAKSTPRALYEAGNMLAKSERYVEAITQWRRAVREKADTSLRVKLYGQLVKNYIAIGKPRRAQQWLQRATREEIEPLRDGKPIKPSDWLAALGQSAIGDGSLPAMRSSLAEPVVLPGKLLLPQKQPREVWPRGRIVTMVDDLAQLRVGPQLEVRWQVEVGRLAQLLWLSEDRVLFFHHGKVIAYDAKTGKQQWEEIDAAQLFKDVASVDGERLMQLANSGNVEAIGLEDVFGDPQHEGKQDWFDAQRQLNARLRLRGLRVAGGGAVERLIEDLNLDVPEGQRDVELQVDVDPARRFFRNDNPRPVAAGLRKNGALMNVDAVALGNRPAFDILVNDAIICLADTAGRTVGIDLDTGKVAWRFRSPFSRMEHIAMNGESVVIAGFERGAPGSTSRMIVALDALTGETLCTLDAPNLIAWLGFSDDGSVVTIHQQHGRRDSKAHLTNHQLPDGEILWRQELDGGEVDGVVQGGDALMVMLDDVGPVVVDLNSRKVSGPVVGLVLDVRPSIDVTIVGDQWNMMTSRALLSLDVDTTLRWRDALDRSVGSRLIQLATRDLMVLVTQPDTAEYSHGRPPIPDLGIRQFPNHKQAARTYEVMLLDRREGKIVYQHVLSTTSGAIASERAMAIDHRIILSTETNTIVIPDASLRKD